jgi:hypothetical protein
MRVPTMNRGIGIGLLDQRAAEDDEHERKIAESLAPPDADVGGGVDEPPGDTFAPRDAQYSIHARRSRGVR